MTSALFTGQEPRQLLFRFDSQPCVETAVTADGWIVGCRSTLMWQNNRKRWISATRAAEFDIVPERIAEHSIPTFVDASEASHSRHDLAPFCATTFRLFLSIGRHYRRPIARLTCQSTKSLSIASDTRMGMQQQRLETAEDSSLDETREIEAELSILTERQYEALQKASYLRMSEAEREAIDQRRVRIGELAVWLAKSRPKTQDVA